MRQNRDGSEAFSAGACVSAAEASVSASALFYPRLAFISALEFLVLSFGLPGLLALASCSALVGIAPSFSPCSSLLLPQISSPLRLKCLSPSKSLTLYKLCDPPTGSQTAGPQTQRRSPELTARALPSPPGPGAPPGCTPPAPPARTWSPWPAPPLLLPSTRVPAGAGVLNRVSRAQGAGPRAPYWPPWLPITRHSRPGPAQPLWSQQLKA